MKNWKMIFLVAVAILLLAPTLKVALETMAALYLIAVISRWLVRVLKRFWVPITFAAALYLLK